MTHIEHILDDTQDDTCHCCQKCDTCCCKVSQYDFEPYEVSYEIDEYGLPTTYFDVKDL